MADFLDRFDQIYLPKLGIRAPTMRAIVHESIRRQHKLIFETGTMRKLDNWAGDGQSSLIWNDYANHQGGTFTTVDIDESATKLAVECKVYNAKTSDSVAYLYNHDTMIDLLYLDSFDLDQQNPGEAQLHCLFELTAAMQSLRTGSIVAVDDSPMGMRPDNFTVTGKAGLVAQWFDKIGVKPFTWGYQVAWIMP